MLLSYYIRACTHAYHTIQYSTGQYITLHPLHEITLHTYACAADPVGPNAGHRRLNPEASGLPSWPPPGLGLTVSTLMEHGSPESGPVGRADVLDFEFWRRNGWWNSLRSSHDFTIKKRDVTNSSTNNLGLLQIWATEI